MSDYLVGRGKVYAAKRDSETGLPLGFLDLGNCPSFVLNPGTIGIRNASNAATQLGGMQKSGSSGKLQMTLDEYSKANMAKIFYGKDTTAISGSSEIDELVPAYTGMFCPTEHINISNVVAKNNTKSVTYTEGDDYTVEPSGGIIVLKTGQDGASPWKISYTYEEYDNLAAFSEVPEILWIRFNGINIAEEAKPIIIDVYKVRIVPASNIQFLGDNFSTFSMEGTIQYDALQPSETGDDLIYGNYFRIRTSAW